MNILYISDFYDYILIIHILYVLGTLILYYSVHLFYTVDYVKAKLYLFSDYIISFQ